MRYGNLIFNRNGSGEVMFTNGARIGTVTKVPKYRNRWIATRCNGEVVGKWYPTKLAAAWALRGER